MAKIINRFSEYLLNEKKLCEILKKTIVVSLSNPPLKKGTPDSQRYPLNLYLINIVENIVVFKSLKS